MAALTGTGRLADDVYLLAHHEVSGRPFLQPRAIGLGLAGGLLAELVLAGAIRVAADGLAATGRVRMRDGLVRGAHFAVLRERERHCAGAWLAFLVLTHARALLTSTPEGKTDYIQADVWDPQVILSAARRTLDFSEPVAVILIFVIHFVPDAERPYDVARSLMEPLPPGRYLVLSHAASDIATDFMAAGAEAYNNRVSARITPRDLAGVSRFFDGLEMIGPGVVPLAQWHGPSADRGLQAYCGVGRKS